MGSDRTLAPDDTARKWLERHPSAGIFAAMPDAEHFRMRARDCRTLAKTAATHLDPALLEELADELDAEAELIESREAARKGRVDSE